MIEQTLASPRRAQLVPLLWFFGWINLLAAALLIAAVLGLAVEAPR